MGEIGGSRGGRSGEIGELEDAGWSSEGWEHNACVQPTCSAVLAGPGGGSKGMCREGLKMVFRVKMRVVCLPRLQLFFVWLL
jgi:hypothetical protein